MDGIGVLPHNSCFVHSFYHRQGYKARFKIHEVCSKSSVEIQTAHFDQPDRLVPIVLGRTGVVRLNYYLDDVVELLRCCERLHCIGYRQ